MRWTWIVVVWACASGGGERAEVGDSDSDTATATDADADADADTDTGTGTGTGTGEAEPPCEEACDECSACLEPLFEERGGCALAIKMCAINLQCRALLCCWTGCGGSCDAEYCADPSCGDRIDDCDDECHDTFCAVGQCLSDACGWPYCDEQCPAPAASECEGCVGCRGVCE